MIKLNQSKRYLVISVDYEIFGNGTGDVRQHATGPTERMAAICEKHGVPLTVFFEVEEYLAFERYEKELQEELGYSPAREIRDQIIDLSQRGHDIQLHLHPEWHQATYENREWKLNFNNRSVDDLFQTADETINYIRSRKATINELLVESGSENRVRAYRAGAFWAQPGTKLLAALAANDIVIDSSVVFGLHHTIGGKPLDFRSAPNHRRHWLVSDDVTREDHSGKVWELPIYSRQHRRFRQITWKRLKAKFSGNVPRERRKQMVNDMGVSNPKNLIQFLMEPFPMKFDYHNMTPSGLVRWAKSVPNPEGDELDVLVSIGHTKEHIDDDSFDNFVGRAAASHELSIVGLDEIANLLETVTG